MRVMSSSARTPRLSSLARNVSLKLRKVSVPVSMTLKRLRLSSSLQLQRLRWDLAKGQPLRSEVTPISLLETTMTIPTKWPTSQKALLLEKSVKRRSLRRLWDLAPMISKRLTIWQRPRSKASEWTLLQVGTPLLVKPTIILPVQVSMMIVVMTSLTTWSPLQSVKGVRQRSSRQLVQACIHLRRLMLTRNQKLPQPL